MSYQLYETEMKTERDIKESLFWGQLSREVVVRPQKQAGWPLLKETPLKRKGELSLMAAPLFLTKASMERRGN